MNYDIAPELLGSFSSPLLGNIYIFVKFSFIGISLFFIGVIIFSIFKTTWIRRLLLWDMQEFVTYKPHGVRKLVKQWVKIKDRLDTGMESEYKLAIIEADSILDDILKRMGYFGESLGERLEKLTSASLPNLDDVKEAHKVRNNIVHDPDYKLALDEARKTMAVFEKALVDLQAL